jgi:hypothetical protein
MPIIKQFRKHDEKYEITKIVLDICKWWYRKDTAMYFLHLGIITTLVIYSFHNILIILTS